MPCLPLAIRSCSGSLVVTVLSLEGSKRLRRGVASTSGAGGTFSSSASATGTKTEGGTGRASTSSSLNTTKPGSCIRPLEGVEAPVELVDDDGVGSSGRGGREVEPRREPRGGDGASAPTLPFRLLVDPLADALADPPPFDVSNSDSFVEREIRLVEGPATADARGVASNSRRAGERPVPSSSASSSTTRFGVACPGVAGRFSGSETGDRGRFGSRT